MHSSICDRLGLELPIFAFSHCRDVVAAVTSGGFGVLGVLAFDPARLEIELRWIDEHLDGLRADLLRARIDDGGWAVHESQPEGEA